MIPVVWKVALPVLGKGRLLVPGDPWPRDRRKIPLPGIAAKTREVRAVKITGAILAIPRCCPVCQPDPGCRRDREHCRRRGLRHAKGPSRHRSRHNPAPNECDTTNRFSTASMKACGPSCRACQNATSTHLATGQRILPPKLCRKQDSLRQIAGPRMPVAVLNGGRTLWSPVTCAMGQRQAMERQGLARRALVQPGSRPPVP